ARVERLDTGLTLVDISSIGAGGGSICWVDDQYLPHIGPESAGSLPGPASYGRGGSEPCLTDVALVLGLLDPEYFLGGEMTLDGGAALTALRERVVKPLQGSEQETAAGLYELAVANMSNAVRAITIERGHDPREFAVVSYGGASGLFIAKIAEELGVRRVLIPQLAAVFSAVGLLFTDFVRTREKTINWSVAQNDYRQLSHLFSELQSQAAGDLRQAGFAEDVEYRWEGDFKLGTQAYEVTIPIGPRTFDENSGREFLPLFRQTYERLYGPGTFWVGAEQLALIKNARVKGVGHLAKPHFPGNGPASRYVPPPDRVRPVFLPDQRRWEDVAVFLSTSLASGASFSGPGIVESFDTTVFVPQGWDVQVDSGHNVLMSQAIRGE
ncbi:MAG: hypothetical protein M0Z53_09735, partial [Thermaerobacter sp.]|nr:hypothetical protein [Thermaerobacter sp.]